MSASDYSTIVIGDGPGEPVDVDLTEGLIEFHAMAVATEYGIIELE